MNNVILFYNCRVGLEVLFVEVIDEGYGVVGLDVGKCKCDVWGFSGRIVVDSYRCSGSWGIIVCVVGFLRSWRIVVYDKKG